MSRIVKVSNGDYHVQVVGGGNAIYDLTSPGQFIINGNLDVKGTTTTIESANLNVGLNLFQLNGGISFNLTVVNVSASNGVVTLTFNTQTAVPFAIGSSILVSGFTPSGYNGTYTVVASPTPTTATVSYTNATSASVSVYGTVNTNISGIPSSLYYQSGLSINRGLLNPAEFLFDDSINHFDPTTTITVTSITTTGSIVTFNFSTQSSVPFAAGTSISITGFNPATYNGIYTVVVSPAPTTGSVTVTSSVTTSVTTYGTATANIKGTFLVRTANTSTTPPTSPVLNGLQLRTLTSDGANPLIIDMQGGTATLRLANSTRTSDGTIYSYRATNPDDIPTVAWIQNYIASSWNPSSPSTQGTATVQTIQQPVSVAIGSANSAIQATSSGLLFQVGGVTVTTITSAGTALGNLLIGAVASPNEINNNTGNPLLLSSNANNIEVTSILNLDNQISSVTATAGTASGGTATITFASQPVKPFGIGSSITVAGFTAQTTFNGTFSVTACTTTTVSYVLAGTLTATVFGTVTQSILGVSNKTKMYSSASIGPGRTGLYVANSTITTPDELISRNRAVLLSILL
jgi:hypothetical protein